jgi:preprotein translocase subunit SecF
MTPDKLLIKIRKNWVIADIGLFLLLIGFMIWVVFEILITAFNIVISKNLSDIILIVGFWLWVIGGVTFGLGLFIFGDK